MRDHIIYHLALEAEWDAARGGAYAGTADDQRDGFIHFSTAVQVAASAARHRAGRADVVLVAVDATAATVQAIRDGWISATLNQNFFDAVLDGEIWGKGTITRVIEAINGIEQPKFVNAGVQLITKDNLPE